MAKRKKSPEDRPDGGDPTPLHPQGMPRALEKEIQELGKQLRGKEFESMEEAQAFLEELAASGEGLQPIPSEPNTPLEEAQDFIYEAFESGSSKKRIQLAKKALKTSPDCADAYVLLAEEQAKDLGEVKEFYEKGVQAGERAVKQTRGEDAFEEEAGHFWGILETRPYMRARLGLALCLWELGERREAMEHYTGMLSLNPGDNQGIRYLLAPALLEEGYEQALEELFDTYEDDAGATWVYTRALWRFSSEGASGRANAALTEAVETNPYVPEYLLGERGMPKSLPDFVGLGDKSEAAVYFAEALPSWLGTPGAIEWLRSNR